MTAVLSDPAGPGGAALSRRRPDPAADGRALAQRAGRSFLIAHLATELLTSPDAVDWGNRLPTSVSQAMKTILDRLGDSLEGRDGPVGRWAVRGCESSSPRWPTPKDRG